MSSTEFTEEEQSRYDRQIRLWGIEAQQRMRNATILVVRLRGTATEVIKNIVLAGIGKLVMVDDGDVAEEDLGSGFFFRDQDVGQKRVMAAKARVESLNPLVKVEAVDDMAVLDEENIGASLQSVDLVCVTDWHRDGLVRINQVCREHNVPFYSGGTYGLMGYIFCDLLNHEYITPDRSSNANGQKSVKVIASYSPLDVALRHRWSTLSKRQTKTLNPSALFSILALWQFQATHGVLPSTIDSASELGTIGDALIAAADVNKQVLTTLPSDLTESLSTTAGHEFSPVCAIVGGMLGQDILRTLAAREPPIANFLAFDGNTGGATVSRMSMT
ncbi:hypothetical protein BDZ89DRAFT_957785 [Hymenopellis radicata]|nr:hypothetical protein BDZ89DRAFT_957785 [Hymenopellis radicata]